MTRSSVSSCDADSETHGTVMSMSKRWTTLETVGRCMFLFSVAFFIVGVLITVFGFSNTGIERRQQIPLQILGPTCLAMTVVMWVMGCIFSRLWNLEWKRQQHAFELRDRVQLHALAMDILNNPVISPGMLQDPCMRRQLLLKLRAQKNFDLGSEVSESRRSSRATVAGSHRRYSSVQYEKLLQQERKRSAQSCAGDLTRPSFELPGIQISRIETLDFGSRASLASRSTVSRNSRQFIIIHSDVGSDFSRLSCPSDYSLAGSRSSRSRGSRASSNLSSRMWDFSPRESDWDADISIGSRESQISMARQDWAGGPSDFYQDCLSPVAPRRLSVVTFDTSPTLRRHSSPTCPSRRKDSGVGAPPGNEQCTCCPNSQRSGHDPPSIMRSRDMSSHSLRFSDGVRIVESTRKRSADLMSCRSFKIDEDDRELEMRQGHHHHHHQGMGQQYHQPGVHDSGTQHPASHSSSTPPQHSERKVSMVSESGGYRSDRSDRSDRSRPPLRRNNTDDSEVERRVARLFREIEYSVSESVDESKLHSISSDIDLYAPHHHQVAGSGRPVQSREVQTQTMTETEMKMLDLAEVGESSRKNSRESREGTSNDEEGGGPSGRGGKAKKKKSRSFEKALSTISNALSVLGRRSSHDKRQREVPRAILLQGLSMDKGDEGPSSMKSPPPTYEDVVNKNL